jgi:uridine kinase
MTPHIIGVSGKTGAGKSTLVSILSRDLQATLISWDDFDEFSQEPEDYVEWFHRGGEYSEFHREKLSHILASLKAGKEAMHPALQMPLKPTEYIIFDAPLGRLHQQTGKYIDTWVHLEVPLDVSLCRRILRDFEEVAKTKEELLEEIRFYVDHSRPLFFDEDLKQGADLVIDGMLTPEKQVKIIKQYLAGDAK